MSAPDLRATEGDRSPALSSPLQRSPIVSPQSPPPARALPFLPVDAWQTAASASKHVLHQSHSEPAVQALLSGDDARKLVSTYSPPTSPRSDVSSGTPSKDGPRGQRCGRVASDWQTRRQRAAVGGEDEAVLCGHVSEPQNADTGARRENEDQKGVGQERRLSNNGGRPKIVDLCTRPSLRKLEERYVCVGLTPIHIPG